MKRARRRPGDGLDHASARGQWDSSSTTTNLSPPGRRRGSFHILSAGLRRTDSSQRFLRHFEVVLISLGSPPHLAHF